MRYLASRHFNTLRITFNHGARRAPRLRSHRTPHSECVHAEAVMLNSKINKDWGSLKAPELHRDRTFLHMLRLVSRAAARRGILVVMAAQQLTAGIQHASPSHSSLSSSPLSPTSPYLSRSLSFPLPHSCLARTSVRASLR